GLGRRALPKRARAGQAVGENAAYGAAVGKGKGRRHSGRGSRFCEPSELTLVRSLRPRCSSRRSERFFGTLPWFFRMVPASMASNLASGCSTYYSIFFDVPPPRNLCF